MKKVISGRARDRRDTYPQLTVLHDNRIHDISYILTAVSAVLQEGVDVTPGDDLERILAVDMQVAHSVDVELVGLGLNRVDLDDEFASEVSDFDTMAEYREDVQKKLTSKKEEEAKIAKEEAVLDAVIADAQMEIPDAMLETQQRQLLENFAQRIQAQGITLEQYMQFTGLTAQTMMEQLKPEALKRIQSRLVLEAVAAAEKMEATEEDFEAEVKSMAEAYQMEADKVKELLGEQGAKQVKEDICVRKAADFIVDNAKEAKAAAKKTTKKEKAAEEKPEEA